MSLGQATFMHLPHHSRPILAAKSIPVYISPLATLSFIPSSFVLLQVPYPRDQSPKTQLLPNRQAAFTSRLLRYISLNNQKINYRMSIPSKSSRTEIDFPPHLAALFTVARTDTTHANSTSILKSPFNLTRQNVQAVYQAREGKAKEDHD